MNQTAQNKYRENKKTMEIFAAILIVGFIFFLVAGSGISVYRESEASSASNNKESEPGGSPVRKLKKILLELGELSPEAHNALLAKYPKAHKVMSLLGANKEMFVLMIQDRKFLVHGVETLIEFHHVKYVPEINALMVFRYKDEDYFSLIFPDRIVESCQGSFIHVENGIFYILHTVYGQWESWWVEMMFIDSKNQRKCSASGIRYQKLPSKNGPVLLVGSRAIVNLTNFRVFYTKEIIAKFTSKEDTIRLEHHRGELTYVKEDLSDSFVVENERILPFSKDWVMSHKGSKLQFFNKRTWEKSQVLEIYDGVRILEEGLLLWREYGKCGVCGYVLYNFYTGKKSKPFEQMPVFKSCRKVGGIMRFESGEGTYFDLDLETMEKSPYKVGV